MDELEQIEKNFDNLITSSVNLNEFGIFDLNNILYGYTSETNTFNKGINHYVIDLNRFYKNLPSQNINLDTYDKIIQKYDEVKEKIKNKREEVSKILEAKEKDLESINSKISDFKKKITQIEEEIKKHPNDQNLHDAKIDLENDLDKEYNKKIVNEFGEKIKQNSIYRDRVTRINKRLNQKGKSTQQAQQNNQQQTQNSKSGPTPMPKSTSAPTPSGSTPTPKPTPKSKPIIKENSIQDYMNKGIIPKIPMNEFSKILDDLSINHLNTSDLFNKVLTNEELNRILLNKTVNMYKMKDDISLSNKGIIQDYDTLLKNYDNMQKSLRQKGANDEADYFNDVNNKLNDEKKDEKQKVSSIKVDDINSYNLSGKENKILDRIDKKVIVNDENLNTQYRLLEGYKIQKNLGTFSSNKKLIEKRIKKTEERIKKLQQKQGKLTEKQTMIVNKNNAKYIKSVKARQQTYARNQAVSSALVQNINDSIFMTQDSTKRTNLNNSSIKKLNGDSLSEKARRGILRGNNKVLQARIAAAEKMRGMSSSMLEQQLRVSTNQIKGQVAHSM